MVQKKDSLQRFAKFSEKEGSDFLYYGELNLEMQVQKITQREMCRMIGIKEWKFSQMMRGHVPWPIDVCYAVLDVLNLPKKDVYTYFPPSEGKELRIC